MKNILSMIIGLLVIAGGFYYVYNPIETPKASMKEDVLAYQKAKNFKPCDIAKKQMEQSSCEAKLVIFNDEKAAIVKLLGDSSLYGVVLPTGEFQQISTNLYFEPKNKVTEYLEKSGIIVDDESWKSVQTSVYLSKRGYLLKLAFQTPGEGHIFISPNGRITGKLQ